MKTALFVNTFLHGKCPASDETRLVRIEKFLKYYESIREHLGFEQIYISDNGGSADQIKFLLDRFPKIELIRHDRMYRGVGHPIYDQLPCWRALYDYIHPIRADYDKIIVADDDAYIVSARLAKHVKDLSSGWETYWCSMYNFPELALNVLCKDAFDTYFEFTTAPMESRNKTGRPMEELIPFTKVNKDFKTDRWGENHTKQEDWMDGYFQCPADLDLKFNDT